MSKLRIPIFHRLFASFILCSILPLIIIGSLMYGLSLNFLKRTLREQTTASIETFQAGLNARISAYEDMILAIQGNSNVSDVLSSSDISFSDSDQARSNEIYEILFDAISEEVLKPIVHITDLEGDLFFSTSFFPEYYKARLLNKWGIFRKIDSQPDDPVIYPHVEESVPGRKTVFCIGGRILDRYGKHTGYVLIEMPRQVVYEEARILSNGLQLHMVLLDDRGYTLYDSINSSMEGKFQQASYLDSEKIRNHKPMDGVVDGNRFLDLQYREDRLGSITRVHVSSDIFQAFNRILTLIMAVGSLVSLLVSVMLAAFQARSISSPIRELIRVMSEVEKGSLEIRANLGSRDEIGDLGKYFNQMLNRLNLYMEKVIEKQKQLRITEIKMLQAQIKPHFIYNTLDVIKWSVKLGHYEETISVVTNLARLLRFSIDSAEEFLTIRSNIDFISSYLAIQRIKYNNSFEVETVVEPSLMDYKIPRLILQPFIENSIIHGFGKTNKTDGRIIITGRFCDCSSTEEGIPDCKVIEFRISDNGIGMTQQEIDEIMIERPDNHIGIYNVDKRIKMYFGNDYGVQISGRDQGTEVVIRMPSGMEGELL